MKITPTTCDGAPTVLIYGAEGRGKPSGSSTSAMNCSSAGSGAAYSFGIRAMSAR